MCLVVVRKRGGGGRGRRGEGEDVMCKKHTRPAGLDHGTKRRYLLSANNH